MVNGQITVRVGAVTVTFAVRVDSSQRPTRMYLCACLSQTDHIISSVLPTLLKSVMLGQRPDCLTKSF